MHRRKITKQAQRAWDIYDRRQVLLKEWGMRNPPLVNGSAPAGCPVEFPHPPFPDPRGPRPEDWRFFDKWLHEAFVKNALEHGR